MKLSNAIAGLACPSCKTLQSPGPLLRTMKGDEDWIACVACKNCEAPIRIRAGDGVVFTISVFAGVCITAWIAGVFQYLGEGNLPAFGTPAFFEAVLRFAVYLCLVIWVVVPFSSRLLSVELSS